MYKFIRSLHKWVGLAAGLWIGVLGFTGLMLDHRDDWGWAWRLYLSDRLLPAATVERLRYRHVTLAQADPEDAARWVVGGPNGLWQTGDGGSNWQVVEFAGREQPPMVFAIVQDAVQGWSRLWLATDDGVWSLKPEAAGNPVERIALPGRRVTALDNGPFPDSLAAVIDRSEIIVWRPGGPAAGEAVTGTVLQATGLPERISWSRFLFDLHLGRALFDRPVSLAINDFAALAFVLLGLSGFAHWYLKRRYRNRRGPGTHARVRTLKTLFRLHAPLLGLLALVPLCYLALTGIVMDHRDALIRTLARNTVPRTALPPVYDFRSLAQEISHVIAYPGDPERYTIGTRLGVFTTIDGGVTWARELGQPASPGYVWSLKRFGEDLFLGGLGGPSFVRPLAGDRWSMVPGLIGMPSDATVTEDAWYVISGPTVFAGDLHTGMAKRPFTLPDRGSRSLMLLMFELHNGKLIHTGFRYVLDVFAVLTLLMALTGPVLWWRRKW